MLQNVDHKESDAHSDAHHKKQAEGLPDQPGLPVLLTSLGSYPQPLSSKESVYIRLRTAPKEEQLWQIRGPPPPLSAAPEKRR